MHRHSLERGGAEQPEEDNHQSRRDESPYHALPEKFTGLRFPGKTVLVKRPLLDPRHNPCSEQRSPKTQYSFQKEIHREPSGVFLVAGECGQEPEKELAEDEEQKSKDRKSPARSDSLRANKNRCHSSMHSAIHRSWAQSFIAS
jgi:hypothetical protein